MAIYFPALRWKLGERCALENLIPTVKDQIAPIIGFPLDCNYIDPKFGNFCTTATHDWGVGRPFYLDLSTVNYDKAPKDEHPALSLLRTGQQQQLAIIPVLTPDMDPSLLEAIKQAHEESSFKNVALRITANEEDDAVLAVRTIINDLGMDIPDIDLIIDLCDISDGAINQKLILLNALISLFGANYRRTILVSGAVPQQIRDHVGTDESKRIPRYDWQLWLRARRRFPQLLFGDYTIIPCLFREVQYQGPPKIRYTLEKEWFVIRGHRQRQRDNQRQEQAMIIANAPFFRGAQHSFGEMRLRQCADGTWGPGSPTNWVTNDVNQHITFVVSQVSAILAAP
ncbi:beta family protein [Moorella sp. Hama-1]|uniref:beta family protein n=1 Tax=Moorella sp. Hama-1 TaxID=2138101 RepID=UPI001379B849|nr:beta family protein [Moorella sp. Hama-1]BCV20341.1 hypothetical protein hamaS1_04100 [Moorella sp. Hama-1]